MVRETIMLQINKINSLLQGKRLWVAGGVILLLVVLVAVVFGGGAKGQKIQDTMPLFAVKKGQLVINVICPGSIVSREVKILQSELEGRATIITLIPDGTPVKKGDLLVELDASKLMDSKVDQQISVQNAEAAFVQATEKLAVAENQAKSDLEAAALKLTFAKQDLIKYEDGDHPNAVKEAQGAITLAEEKLKRANETLKWSKILFADKYLSQSELQADELAAKTAELDLKLAQSKLDLLQNFTYKRDVAQFTSDANQAEMALERTKRKSSADVVQAQAELAAKQSEFERQKVKLTKLEEQIGKAKIYAPIDGRAIYATSAKGTDWDEQPLAAGQDVSERQELIYLPTADSVKAEVKLHESSLQKVTVGLPARVTADALPSKEFWGTVATIAPLPDARSIRMNPDLKVYPTEIFIEGDVSQLRTGWSCRAEIIVAQYPDALQVPMQAVTRAGGKPCVYVVKNGQMTRRDIEVGLDNGTMVRIISGLTEGEQVALDPPVDRTKTSDKQVSVPDGLSKAAGKSGRQKAGASAADSNSPGGKGGGDQQGQGQQKQRRQKPAGGSGQTPPAPQG
jgi:HlyD family secretion protein